MKSRSSAELQKECQNLPPCPYPDTLIIHGRMQRGEMLENLSYFTHFWLMLNLCKHKRKVARMDISQAPTESYDYKNASFCLQQDI